MTRIQIIALLALPFLISPPITMAAENSPPIKAAKCTFTDSTSQFFDHAALTWKVERRDQLFAPICFCLPGVTHTEAEAVA